MPKEQTLFPMLNWALLIVVIMVVAYNAITVAQMTGHLKGGFSFGKSSSKNIAFSVGKSTGDHTQDAINAIISKGVPDVYGQELGISFDDPVHALAVLSALHQRIPYSSMTPEQKKEYVNVTQRTSCEFCCGAPALTDAKGNDLCGCNHAYSQMGLAAYLITQHPGEYTPDQIVAEDTKWKALFFPKQMITKAVAALDNNLELTPALLNDRNLLSKIKANDVNSIGDLPSMVGGC